MDDNATKSVLPSKEALLEFLKTHKWKPTATAAITTARKMTSFTPNT